MRVSLLVAVALLGLLVAQASAYCWTIRIVEMCKDCSYYYSFGTQYCYGDHLFIKVNYTLTGLGNDDDFRVYYGYRFYLQLSGPLTKYPLHSDQICYTSLTDNTYYKYGVQYEPAKFTNQFSTIWTPVTSPTFLDKARIYCDSTLLFGNCDIQGSLCMSVGSLKDGQEVLFSDEEAAALGLKPVVEKDDPRLFREVLPENVVKD